MAGIIASSLVVCLCLVLHFLLCASGVVKKDYPSPIRKLIFQAQLLLGIWIVLTPAYFFIYRWLQKGAPAAWLSAFDNGQFYFVYGIIFFGILFFLYLTVYYVVDRSVSTRIMIEIEASPQKQLTFEQLRVIYHPDTKYAVELEGMCQGGFARKEGAVYKNTLKGSLFSRFVWWYKQTFKLGLGG